MAFLVKFFGTIITYIYWHYKYLLYILLYNIKKYIKKILKSAFFAKTRSRFLTQKIFWGGENFFLGKIF
jgi:phage-related holin